MKIFRHASLCALLPLFISACAQTGEFPSLAPRAVESESLGEPGRPPQPRIPSDAALLARISALREEGSAGQRAFAADAGRAESLVSKAGKAGSENWVAAQQLVSQLEAARSRTATALADLDALAIERADQPTNSEDFAALLATLEEVRALADAQKTRIDRLQSALSRP